MRLTVAAFTVVPPDFPLVILFDAVIQFPFFFLFFFALIATSAMCCFITFNLRLLKKKAQQKQKLFSFFKEQFTWTYKPLDVLLAAAAAISGIV